MTIMTPSLFTFVQIEISAGLEWTCVKIDEADMMYKHTC